MEEFIRFCLDNASCWVLRVGCQDAPSIVEAGTWVKGEKGEKTIFVRLIYGCTEGSRPIQKTEMELIKNKFKISGHKLENTNRAWVTAFQVPYNKKITKSPKGAKKRSAKCQKKPHQ